MGVLKIFGILKKGRKDGRKEGGWKEGNKLEPTGAELGNKISGQLVQREGRKKK